MSSRRGGLPLSSVICIGCETLDGWRSGQQSRPSGCGPVGMIDRRVCRGVGPALPVPGGVKFEVGVHRDIDLPYLR